MRKLAGLLRPSRAGTPAGPLPAPEEAAARLAPPAPAEPLCVIGDIHGSLSALERLAGRILDEAPEARIVCVGDYVDRGEDSASVLRVLMDAASRDEVACIAGNHEDMLLMFLDEPEAHGPRWLRHGGLQTLASFGLGGASEGARGARLVALRDDLAQAMGEPLIAWLRGLPLTYCSGNVAVVHAGAVPSLPIAAQPRTALLWGDERFPDLPRSDGLWITHGHTIVRAPLVAQGRICVDTGAYATGMLTAAIVAPDAPVRFIST